MKRTPCPITRLRVLKFFIETAHSCLNSTLVLVAKIYRTAHHLGAIRVQMIQTLDVLVAQPDPLANCDPRFDRNDRIITVYCKRIGPIMHHAVVVVRNAKIVDNRRIVPVEVGAFSADNGSPVDLHEEVPIRGALHVYESQRMQELMHDGTLGHAPIRLKVQLLRSADVAQIRPAACVLARHSDVVRLGGPRNELDAADGHNLFQSCLDGGLLAGC